MAALLICLYSLLASISLAWPSRIAFSQQIELIAFGDNTQTVTDFGPFGFRSYPDYWGNLWNHIRTDLGSSQSGYSQDWPIVENSGNTLAVYARSGSFTWDDDEEEQYTTVSTRMNSFNPDTVQQYMRQFINSSVMFHVKGASAPTQGLLGDPQLFNFDTCIADNPPKIWLTTKCQMNSGSVPIWQCPEPICDWRSVWKQYIFPNAELISSVTGSGVNDYKVDIQFDFAYTSYCDLQSDLVYNGGEFAGSSMEATLRANFPPIVSGNVTNIDLDCDVVALTCINSNYCTWTLPWLDKCNYTVDACDTTTTSLSPTNAPISTTTTSNPTRSTTNAPTESTMNPSTSAPSNPTSNPTTGNPTTSNPTTTNPAQIVDETMATDPGSSKSGNDSFLGLEMTWIIVIAASVVVLVAICIVMYCLCKKKGSETGNDQGTAKVENTELVQRTEHQSTGQLTNIVQIEKVDFNSDGF
eukprot:367529_1